MKPHALLTAREIIAAIKDLRSAGTGLPLPSSKAILVETLQVRLPAWVTRSGLLRDGQNFWLYCAPDSGAVAASAGQLLIQLPPGRYLIDSFNIATGTCVARESAAGDPLVAGLAYAPAPILLWIRPPV
jgi:hypothetical protein